MTMRAVKPKRDEYATSGPVKGTLKQEKSPPRYPRISLDLDTLPEAKGWKISTAGAAKGKDYIVELKVRMIGMSQSQYSNNVDLELRGIDVESAEQEADEEEDAGEGEENGENNE